MFEDYASEEMQSEPDDIIHYSRFITLDLVERVRIMLNTMNDELRLMSGLTVFRKYLLTISHLSKNEVTAASISQLSMPTDYIDLACVLDEKDDIADFFNNVLNIKRQKRYKAIRQI